MGEKMSKNIIELTKMDTRKILINVSSIETVEANPDTVIILSTGRKLLVKESLEDIYKRIND
jgi:flagellar protein FlbD